ncbi:hypothetical protein L5515_018963 [Caenorhabditis briggsae]|uniref:Uncharacterized protein n=1 Tax=Caenorhabditis briggsae TaxID=6238 RepID=A0AAE9JT87_CAEBR|nr:hypothetical protein L5515_018963 [Caenorhabditis briggsae]
MFIFSCKITLVSESISTDLAKAKPIISMEALAPNLPQIENDGTLFKKPLPPAHFKRYKASRQLRKKIRKREPKTIHLPLNINALLFFAKRAKTEQLKLFPMKLGMICVIGNHSVSIPKVIIDEYKSYLDKVKLVKIQNAINNLIARSSGRVTVEHEEKENEDDNMEEGEIFQNEEGEEEFEEGEDEIQEEEDVDSDGEIDEELEAVLQRPRKNNFRKLQITQQKLRLGQMKVGETIDANIFNTHFFLVQIKVPNGATYVRDLNRCHDRIPVLDPPIMYEMVENEKVSPHTGPHPRADKYPPGFSYAMIEYCEDPYWMHPLIVQSSGIKAPTRPSDHEEQMRELFTVPPFDSDPEQVPGVSVIPIPQEALDLQYARRDAFRREQAAAAAENDNAGLDGEEHDD